MVIKDVSKMDPELGENINTEILRFSRDLMGIRYLTNEQGEMIKTDDNENYFILTDTIQTDTERKKIDDIIEGVRTNYSNEQEKLEYYDNIIQQKLKIPSIFTNSNEEEEMDINESEQSEQQVTKKQKNKISDKIGYPVLLTPTVTPKAMLTLVNEVLKPGFKLARIIGDKDKKDKKRKESIEERINCLISQMYKDIEVIELDTVNDVKTGPIIRILRELIEMIVFKEPIMHSESTIPEKYNIFIPGNNIVVSKLNELMEKINSQLIIDYSDSSSDETYYSEFENDESQSGTQSTVYYDSESSLGDQSQESIDIGMYPGFSVSEEPVVSKKVTDALSKQSNTLLKKASKRFASLNELIGEISDRLYILTTSNTKSGKIPPKKILPNVPRIPIPNIAEDNEQPEITLQDGRIFVLVDQEKGHYKIKGDTNPDPTLYFNNGEEIYGDVPDLEPIPENVGGKRSPGGKRTRKIRRGKKKTRKGGNKKNKSKKRKTRVNKKRAGSKTRKNV